MISKQEKSFFFGVLLFIGLGIWVIVFQNFGLIPGKQQVEVMNSVDIGNTVDIKGSVDVDNTVDINIKEILGGKAGCRTSYTVDGKEYRSLDVSAR